MDEGLLKRADQFESKCERCPQISAFIRALSYFKTRKCSESH